MAVAGAHYNNKPATARRDEIGSFSIDQSVIRPIEDQKIFEEESYIF